MRSNMNSTLHIHVTFISMPPFSSPSRWINAPVFGRYHTSIYNQWQVQSIAPAVNAPTLRLVRVDLGLSHTIFDDECMERWLDGLNRDLINKCFLDELRSRGIVLCNSAQRPKDRTRMAQGLFFNSSTLPLQRAKRRPLTAYNCSPTEQSDGAHKGVTITMAATAIGLSGPDCRRAPPRSVLFRAIEPAPHLLPCAFERNHLFTTFRRRLTLIGLPALHISGRSFRRDAAHHADKADLAKIKTKIKTLGRKPGAFLLAQMACYYDPRPSLIDPGRTHLRTLPAGSPSSRKALTVTLSPTTTFPGLR
ncbi:hypothetical protein E4U16_008206 [Claviceps sp. LM84 group G4]|nr:hypothetical protein E4U16_008206 [Claviceps sp. LM84 group G4]